MPQYLSGASQLKDVSVSIINVNKLINIFGKQNFKGLDIYDQQLRKIDKFNQNQANNNNNKNNKNKNKNKNKKEDIKMSNLTSSPKKIEVERKNENENENDDVDSVNSINSKSSSEYTNTGHQNPNLNPNQSDECINSSVYNSNKIDASDPTPFASNDFISKIPNYKWHINDVTKDKSSANMGILEIYDSHHIAFRDLKFYNHYTKEFNSVFLVNFDKIFIIHDLSTIRA